MAQATHNAFYGMIHTHPDVSPFVPLAAHLQLRMNFAAGAHPSQQQARTADSMQIDAAAAGTARSGATAASGSGPSTHPSEAGPSGVQPGGPYDSQSGELLQRRPARKHSDAPVRKLSVSLIDTYKLINQVRFRPRRRRPPEPSKRCIHPSGTALAAPRRGVGGEGPSEPARHAAPWMPARGPDRRSTNFRPARRPPTVVAAFCRLGPTGTAMGWGPRPHTICSRAVARLSRPPERSTDHPCPLTAPCRFITRSASGGKRRRRRARRRPQAVPKKSARAASTTVRAGCPWFPYARSYACVRLRPRLSQDLPRFVRPVWPCAVLRRLR